MTDEETEADSRRVRNACGLKMQVMGTCATQFVCHTTNTRVRKGKMSHKDSCFSQTQMKHTLIRRGEYRWDTLPTVSLETRMQVGPKSTVNSEQEHRWDTLPTVSSGNGSEFPKPTSWPTLKISSLLF